MFATIELTPYVQVQGEVSRRLPGGRVVIRVAGHDYAGAPLSQARALRVVHGVCEKV